MYSVSVIMPVYNNEETLTQAVESVLNQTVYDLELILVNDGSTDASAEICDDYAKEEPLLVEVIHQERNGFGQARNKGLLHSSGKYVYFAQTTDILQNNLLEDNLKLAEEKEAELVVFGFTEQHPNYLHGKVERYPRLPDLLTQEMFRQHYRNFHHFYPFALHNKFYQREYLRKNRICFQNIPTKEEAYFNLKVQYNLKKIVFNRVSYVIHHAQYETSKNTMYDIHLKFAYSFEDMIDKWGYKSEFQDLIDHEYYQVVYTELQVITAKGLGLNKIEQGERIREILVDEKVSQSLSKIKPSKERNPHMKAVLIALKKSNEEEAIQLIRQNKNPKKTKSKMSRLFKKIFKR